MSPSISLSSVVTTLLQYLVGIAVVALGCLPSLAVSNVRARLGGWPTDRLVSNYLLLVVVVAAGQWAVIVGGWELLHIGSTQADPQFRALRLVALLVGYPLAVLGVGTVGVRLYCRDTREDQWLTPRTLAGLGATVVWYIATVFGAAIVVLIIGLFVALPT
jgi:hypothetical protein